MEMKVKSGLIRKIRSEKLWSQEQLADACGLSLRTIQRLESSGNASAETVRALAAVLEMQPDELMGDEGEFEGYRHTQRGDHVLIILFVVFTFSLAISSLPGELDLFAAGFITLIIGISAILFCSLTIEINDDFICWHFGPGFWKKRIALADISDCSSVENSFWWGFGIRNYGAGWLYNVSGIHAVELNLASGAVLRLGTDEPNYLKAAIENAKAAC